MQVHTHGDPPNKRGTLIGHQTQHILLTIQNLVQTAIGHIDVSMVVSGSPKRW